ncbi:MAG TPA: hydantoinase/oxoprolinase family protein, partial [Acidimicrobiia bacterium]|nr:hydantoinase/oxoprolinase family protein [Acidimicrobiia bacterium]
TLDVGAATRALSSLGSALSMGVETLAAGIIEVVDTHMERALRAVSVEEGVDPRDSALVAFGGAGALHATRLARRLGIGTIFIPPLSGVFSALGLLLAAPSSDAERTVMLEEGSARLGTVARGIFDEARATFSEHHGVAGDELTGWAELRYVGQSHELSVPLSSSWDELRAEFETAHRARFGFVRSAEPIELVTVRAVMTGRPPVSWDDLPRLHRAETPTPSRSQAVVGDGTVDVPVWARADLPPGFEMKGPAVVVEPDSAVWLEPDDSLSVHDDGTLEVTW